jgi:hypothetical protein
MWPESIQVEAFLGSNVGVGDGTVTLPVLVAVQATDSLDEARALREVLPEVIDAIHGDPDLGLTGVDCKCDEVRDFGRILFGEAIAATTARITVEVLLS